MASDFAKIMCFDLDGTLADSGEAHAQSFNLAFEKNNLPIKPIKLIISKLGPTSEKVVRSLFSKISKRKLAQVIKDKKSFFVKYTYKLAKPLPGVGEALQELSKDFKLALVSNATRDEILQILKAAKLPKKLFSAVLGYGEMHGKPDPDIIDAVEQMAKGKVEYFVGDTTYDIKTGKAAEVKTIAVLTGVHSVKKLTAEDPTIIIESVSLLPEYFRGEL